MFVAEDGSREESFSSPTKPPKGYTSPFGGFISAFFGRSIS
jgi:hypothetical protein